MIKEAWQLIDAYDEKLDAGGPVEVAGRSYWPSEVLKCMDSFEYINGLLDFADGLAKAGELPDGWEEWPELHWAWW